MYTSNGWLSKWSIWSQFYREDEERPQFYSDEVSLLKHAKRVMTTHLSLFVPLIVMNSFLMVQHFNNELMNENVISIDMFEIVISLVIIELSVFCLKSLFYYRRMQKKLDFNM